jgi:hypothetical protein
MNIMLPDGRGADVERARAASISRATRPHAQHMTARLHDARVAEQHPRTRIDIATLIQCRAILPILEPTFSQLKSAMQHSEGESD